MRWSKLAGPRSPEEWMVEASRQEAAMLEADRGRLLGFARVVATKASG